MGRHHRRSRSRDKNRRYNSEEEIVLNADYKDIEEKVDLEDERKDDTSDVIESLSEGIIYNDQFSDDNTIEEEINEEEINEEESSLAFNNYIDDDAENFDLSEEEDPIEDLPLEEEEDNVNVATSFEGYRHHHSYKHCCHSNCNCNNNNNDFSDLLRNYVGETVTIFTTSGGESGSGFTGILITINHCYIRLIIKIGPAPACSLGNCCNPKLAGNDNEDNYECNDKRDLDCSFDNVGAVVDIPVDKIAAFVHNAV